MTTPSVPSPPSNPIDQLKRQCWDLAVHAFGTHRISARKAKEVQWRLKALTFLGLAGPALTAYLVTNYGMTNQVSHVALFGLSIVGGIQLVLTVLAVSFKWEDRNGQLIASDIENHRLASELTMLAKTMPTDLAEAQSRFNVLFAQNQARTSQDSALHFSAEDERFGMRVALRNYQRKCAGCGIEPLTLVPSNCPVCGNYRKKWSK